jgi:hypothetical protein
LTTFASTNGEQQKGALRRYFGRDEKKPQNSGHKNLKGGNNLRHPGVDWR